MDVYSANGRRKPAGASPCLRLYALPAGLRQPLAE